MRPLTMVYVPDCLQQPLPWWQTAGVLWVIVLVVLIVALAVCFISWKE